MEDGLVGPNEIVCDFRRRFFRGLSVKGYEEVAARTPDREGEDEFNQALFGRAVCPVEGKVVLLKVIEARG